MRSVCTLPNSIANPWRRRRSRRYTLVGFWTVRRSPAKVQATDAMLMRGDIESMLHTTKAMRWLGLDEPGFSHHLPRVLGRHRRGIRFRHRGREDGGIRKLLDGAGLSDRIAVPQVITATRRVLIMRRVRGAKLLTIFNRASASRKVLSPPIARGQVSRGGRRGMGGRLSLHVRRVGGDDVEVGHFHTDPHPGNFMVANDGKLILLDWGQTKRVTQIERMHMCRLSLYMANEDHASIAREIENHGSVRLERPTTEALSALAYAYFDTRPSPLAEMNVMDFKTHLVQNKILQNTQEGFFAIRSVFLLRGMLSTCGLRMSMVESWQPIAREAMISHGEAPPSRFRLKTKLVINRSTRFTTPLEFRHRRQGERRRRIHGGQTRKRGHGSMALELESLLEQNYHSTKLRFHHSFRRRIVRRRLTWPSAPRTRPWPNYTF